MKRSGGGFLSSAGFTLIELMVYMTLAGFVSYGAIRLIQNTTTAQKKASTLVAIENTQNLALQNFVKRPTLKKSLANALGSSQMLLLENCFSSLGTDCKNTFDTKEYSLVLDASDKLATDVAGTFAQDQRKCADPNNCNKLFEQTVIVTLNCPSNVRCTNLKIKVASALDPQSKQIAAPRAVEVDIPAIELVSAGLKGLCASNQGYVNSINLGNNSLGCEDGSQNITPVAITNQCAAASFVEAEGKILAGLADSGISNVSNCQSVPVPDWSDSAVGYPTAANLMPSATKVLPLNTPRVNSAKFEGDIVLILDDSKSMTKARTEVAKGIRKLVENMKTKQGSLNLSAYTTDTYRPLSTSIPGIQSIPHAGVKAIYDSTGTGDDQIDTETITLNDPFINMEINPNTPNAAAEIESSILDFPYAEGEETESAACTMMRYLLEENQKPKTQLNRKKVFLMFSDELDVYNGTNVIPSDQYGDYCRSRRISRYTTHTKYLVNKRTNLNLGHRDPKDETQYVELPYPEADIKVTYYAAAMVSIRFKYTFTQNDTGTQTGTYSINAIINIADYGLDPSEVSKTGMLACPESLRKDGEKYFRKAVTTVYNRGDQVKVDPSADAECTVYPSGGAWATSSRLRDYTSKEQFTADRQPLAAGAQYGNSPIVPTQIFKSSEYTFNGDHQRATEETTKTHFYPVTVHYLKENGTFTNYEVYYKPTDLVPPESYTEVKYRGGGAYTPPTNVAEDLSDILGFSTRQKPKGDGTPKNTVELISDSLEKTYGDMYGFVGLVHTKDSNTSCSGPKAEKNSLFLDLAAKLPKSSSSIVDFCDFNKYESAFDSIENYLTTSDVDYVYEVALDESTKENLKTFLSTHTVDELSVEISLLKTPDSAAAPDLTILFRSVDFNIEVKDKDSMNPKLFVKFSNNDKMNDYLKTFKHLKVKIGQ